MKKVLIIFSLVVLVFVIFSYASNLRSKFGSSTTKPQTTQGSGLRNSESIQTAFGKVVEVTQTNIVLTNDKQTMKFDLDKFVKVVSRNMNRIEDIELKSIKPGSVVELSIIVSGDKSLVKTITLVGG